MAARQAEKLTQRRRDTRVLAVLAAVVLVLAGGGAFAFVRRSLPRLTRARWADGAAGITVPAARAHGPYTAAQVRSALQITRRLLIAGNLDWPTLRGGTPAAFADLLTSQERKEFLSGLHTTALNHDGSERNTRTWVASFAPGTRFLTNVIKVSGTMSASTATDSGSVVLLLCHHGHLSYCSPADTDSWAGRASVWYTTQYRSVSRISV